MANIPVPQEYLEQFQKFDYMEGLLKTKHEHGGVSRANISAGFAALVHGKTCWRDPAFMLWASAKGITQYGDFFTQWKRSKPLKAEP